MISAIDAQPSELPLVVQQKQMIYRTVVGWGLSVQKCSAVWALPWNTPIEEARVVEKQGSHNDWDKSSVLKLFAVTLKN